MKYMGSKRKLVREILPIMLKQRKPNQCWVEPFVGGGNVIQNVDGPRIGVDCNRYAIEALISIRDHVEDLPKNKTEFTESDYKKLRNSDDYRFKGFAGFAYSYGGKWLGGWRRDAHGARDYVAEAYRSAKIQSPLISNAVFIHADYRDVPLSDPSVIYCDPPYQNCTGYGYFDHKLFWERVRMWWAEGHTVFVSEYSAPEDFTCIWSKRVHTSLTSDTGSKIGIEKLFTLTQ